MKKLMAQIKGNQHVDGHERPTSTYIMRINDGIDFVINNG
jgi:hypothetical protein